MSHRLKNIVFWQVVVLLVLVSALYAKNTLVDSMTEYNIDYNLVVKK